ncbi:MAG: MBL fold metallo-hydrolase [Desulfobacterales bacterium]
MKVFKKHEFGEVTGWELGWSPVGRPVMTVFLYVADGVMIDTGLRHMRRYALEIARRSDIGAILLTHYHEDHSGNAAVISGELDVPVYGHFLTAGKLASTYRIFPYQHLIWGRTEPVTVRRVPDVWEKDGLRLQPLHTPGHSSDHLAYLDAEHGRLFSGDLFLSERIKYFRADEQIDEQIDSLRKVLSLDFEALYCGHRPMPEQGKEGLEKKLRYLEGFYGSVAHLAARGMDENQIMRQLHLKEQYLVKLMCFGNVSMKNMVCSVMRAEDKKAELKNT